jgi:purine-binding chemotaxis protein CheW
MASSGQDGSKKSTAILSEIARRREERQVVDVEAERIKVVIVSLRGDLYAFRGENVKEILPILPVFPVPGTPEWLPGVINVRGQVESVLDLARFLRLPASNEGTFQRILIGEAGGVRSGIFVDSVVDVLDLPVADLGPPLGTLGKSVREFVSGAFPHRDALVSLLDLTRVFAGISG